VDVSSSGKVALVTRAGPNIGCGIALALSRYGNPGFEAAHRSAEVILVP
jgi:NAD(P)-dependent dehydrogenase (short-subunit alcohol dehydrogenase family)